MAIDSPNQVGDSTFLEDSKFFLHAVSRREVNIILHLVSFSFLLYGLAVKSLSLVFIFDEMGHAYNYLVVHNRDPRFGALGASLTAIDLSPAMVARLKQRLALLPEMQCTRNGRRSSQV